MLQVPTLPTDSLYKFLFVFGIVLIISSQFIGDHLLENYNQSLKKDTELIAEHVNKIDGLQQEIADKGLSTQKKDSLQLLYKIEVASASRFMKRFEDQNSMDRYLVNSNVSSLNFALYLGYTLALLGSILWYVKIQYIQDRILKLQLKELTAQVYNK